LRDTLGIRVSYQHSAAVQAGFCSAGMTLIDGRRGNICYVVVTPYVIQVLMFWVSVAKRISCREIFGVSRFG